MGKTAVDVYEEKSIELINLYVNGEIDVRELLTRHHNIYYEIKEMEKQQIIDAAADHCYPTCELARIDAEKYYTSTYGSKGSDEHHEDKLDEKTYTEEQLKLTYMQGYNRGVDGNPNQMESYIEQLKQRQ